MSKREIMVTRVAEMLDMISCFAVYNGAVNQKAKKRRLSYDEAIALR